MFPERFWIAVGSGQLLNEHITGERWPSKPERNERLRESADIMRRLWAGETVSHDGHVTVSEARLWTRPEQPPMLVGAAVTPETAGWVAGWADALITVVQADETLDEIVDGLPLERRSGQADVPPGPPRLRPDRRARRATPPSRSGARTRCRTAS